MCLHIQLLFVKKAFFFHLNPLNIRHTSATNDNMQLHCTDFFGALSTKIAPRSPDGTITFCCATCLVA